MASLILILREPLRDRRGLSCYRRTLVEQRAQRQVRVRKALDRNGVGIGGVLTGITRDVIGRRILEGIFAGDARETVLRRRHINLPPVIVPDNGGRRRRQHRRTRYAAMSGSGIGLRRIRRGRTWRTEFRILLQMLQQRL